MDGVNFSDDECPSSQDSQDVMLQDAISHIDELVSDDEGASACIKKTMANVSLEEESSPPQTGDSGSEYQTTLDKVSDNIRQNLPGSPSIDAQPSDSDSDHSSTRVRIAPGSPSMDARPSESDSDSDIRINRPASPTDHSPPPDPTGDATGDSTGSDSDDEPLRIFRGPGPREVPNEGGNDGGPDDERMGTHAPGVGQVGKKPKKTKKEEQESFRDQQIRMRDEHESAKAEQARLLRETTVKLPRHEKVFSLDFIETNNSRKQTSTTADKQPQNQKTAERRARILALAAKNEPKFGQGYLDLNPGLLNLQQKMVKHTTKKKSPTKTATKIMEAVKNDIGEIIEIKEKIIHIETNIEEDELFKTINKKSKLTSLKSKLMEKLREERMKNFQEEQVVLKAREECNEDNYLDSLDDAADQMAPDALESSETDTGSEADEEDVQQDDNEQKSGISESEKTTEVTKVKKRRKKKREKKRRVLESSSSESDDPPEPFQDFSDTSQSKTSSNPYNQLSRINNRAPATCLPKRNMPVTPDRESLSPLSQSIDPSPYSTISNSGFHLNFDFDDETRLSQKLTQDTQGTQSQRISRSLLDDFYDAENAQDASEMESEMNRICGSQPSQNTQNTQGLLDLFSQDGDEQAEDMEIGENNHNTVEKEHSEDIPMNQRRSSDIEQSDIQDMPLPEFPILPRHTEPIQSDNSSENPHHSENEDGDPQQSDDEEADTIENQDPKEEDTLEDLSDKEESEDEVQIEPEPEPDILAIEETEEQDEDIIFVKKKKKAKPKPGYSVNDFAEAGEAELDADFEGANVSGDEDETGVNEYEHEEITEILPSSQKQQKELQKIHNKITRDDDEAHLERLEDAFKADDAKARKSKYKWIIQKGGFDETTRNSSDEDEIDPSKVEALQKAESDRLKTKLARELLVDQEDPQESLFTNTKSSLFGATNAVKLSKHRKKNTFAVAKEKRKNRLGQAFAGLSKGDVYSKPITFQAAEKENRKRQSDDVGSFSKRQKILPDTPKAQKMKKSLFNMFTDT